jgi:hypothetical protein
MAESALPSFVCFIDVSCRRGAIPTAFSRRPAPDADPARIVKETELVSQPQERPYGK